MFLPSDRKERKGRPSVEMAPIVVTEIANNDTVEDRLFVSFLWFKIDGTGKAGVRFAFIVVILILATWTVNTVIKAIAN